MIVTSRIKTRILSLAFNGLLVGYSNKSKQNTIVSVRITFPDLTIPTMDK